MAIGSAVQQGGLIHIYDEKGHFLFSKSGELHGYTGTTVSVKQAKLIHTYDEKGHFKFSKSTT